MLKDTNFQLDTKTIYDKFSYFKIISKSSKVKFFENNVINNFSYLRSMAIFIISWGNIIIYRPDN